MLKNLTLSSIILRVLICLNFGIPALMPSIETPINSPNTTENAPVIDSIQVEKSQSKLFVVTHPDGINSSFLGDFMDHIMNSTAILFLIFMVWGTILRVQFSKNENLIFTLTVLSVISINAYLLSHFQLIVWGFWVVYVLVMNLLIFELFIIFNQQKRKMYS